MKNNTFSQQDMLGYGYAAYCAGWKAAIAGMVNPEATPANHGRDWFLNNPPATLDAPVWRVPPASDATIRACHMCKCTEITACVDDETGRACHWVARDLCSACQGEWA